VTTSDVADHPKAKAIEFDNERLVIHIDDGRSLGIPLNWYPQLRDASSVVRNAWEPVLDGLLVRWPSLDLTLLVSALLKARGPIAPWE
jgi:Protein of unknown function (DUF2442)